MPDDTTAKFRSDFEQIHAEARDLLRAENEAFIIFLPIRDVAGGRRMGVRFVGALSLSPEEMHVMYNGAIAQLQAMRQHLAEIEQQLEEESDAEGE